MTKEMAKYPKLEMSIMGVVAVIKKLKAVVDWVVVICRIAFL